MNADNEKDTAPREEDCWPREVVIRPTVEKAIELLGSEYKGDPEGDDALLWKIGYEMSQVVEISSWDDFQENYKGYDLGDPYLRREYEEHLSYSRICSQSRSLDQQP
jgi:hypothetical protein